MPKKKQKRGFSLVEVMLVLALTGLLMIGLIGGTINSVKSQRYTDTVRSYAEFLRTVYNEVLSPSTLGEGNSQNRAILGKLISYGYNYGNDKDDRAIFTATVVGNADVLSIPAGEITAELAAADARLFCGDSSASLTTTVDRYDLLWQAQLTQIQPNLGSKFTGSVLIVRAPTSGTVHTLYSSTSYDLLNRCSGGSDATGFSVAGFAPQDVSVCVKSDNVNAGQYREVRIAKNGRNSSAVSILSTDQADTYNDEGEVITFGNRCR